MIFFAPDKVNGGKQLDLSIFAWSYSSIVIFFKAYCGTNWVFFVNYTHLAQLQKNLQVTHGRAFYKVTKRGIVELVDKELNEDQTQAMEEIISENWNTVMQIYTQTTDVVKE